MVIRETREHARVDAANHLHRTDGMLGTRHVAVLTSFKERALSSACQAGMVNNLNDALAWGLFPILWASAGLSVTEIGLLAALYPAVWGAGQLFSGAASDRFGRKPFIVVGMLTQAVALAAIAAVDTFGGWAAAQVLLGLGTAAVYPTLLAAVGDVAHPAWRARAVGIYRFWRDGGFAVGAVVAGMLADLYGIRTATLAIAILTAASGVVVAVRMYESNPALSGRAGSSR
jgi:MFS family permease